METDTGLRPCLALKLEALEFLSLGVVAAVRLAMAGKVQTGYVVQ